MQNLTVANNENTSLQEVQPQITTAKTYPRNMQLFLDNAKSMATMTPTIAESCHYSLPRGMENGKPKYINGASVRLAEIAAQNYGNIRVAVTILPEDKSVNYITAQAIAWDLQNNVAIQTETRRKIVDRSNRRYSADMINMTANAAASIAYRNAIFKVIPKAYTDEIYNAAVNYLKSDMQEPTKFKKGIEAAIKYFGKAGYSDADICNYLGRKSVEELDKDDLMILKGIKTRIEAKEITAEEAFVTTTAKNENEATPESEEFFGK